MSLATLKADAAKILQSTSASRAPDALADHLLLKKNRPQLLALARLLLSTLNTKPKRDVVKPHARRREGPHRKHQQPRALVPSAAQKVGALIARAHVADQDVFDHKLRGGKKFGDIRINELPAYIERSAYSATAMLTRGLEDAVDTFLCAGAQDICVPSDPFNSIRDTLKKNEANKLMEHAKIRAAEVLRDKSALLAQELIALAHDRGATELRQ
jgi:hypothetical protein